MPRLILTCFDTLQVNLDGQPVTFRSAKDRALLVYLTLEQARAHTREALAGLLWPDAAEARARRNLSTTLLNLRKAIGDRSGGRTSTPSFLLITPQTIAFNPAGDYQIDVVTFDAHLATTNEHAHTALHTCEPCARAFAAAVDLYRGPFLDGFSIAGSDLFEQWLLTRREKLHRQALDAFTALSTYHENQGMLSQALAVAQRLLDLAPWQEEAHRQLMWLLALNGQRTQALAQYEACCQALDDELGVPPSDATNALYDQILVGDLDDVPAQIEPESATADMGDHEAARAQQPVHNLPRLDGPFIGRDAELARVAAHFTQETSQLLTLVGTGGIGKTHMALEFGWRIVHDAGNSSQRSVYFVSVAEMGHAVDAEQTLMVAIADSLGLPLVGVQAPFDVIVGYLQNKEVLLIIDNCEEAGDAIAQVPTLLGQAPRLQILATSREPLDLADEFLLRLDGLPFPQSLPTPTPAADDDPIVDHGIGNGTGTTASQPPVTPEMRQFEAYQAVQLFVHHARRIEDSFSLGQIARQDQVAIARICQLCEGMPLALEMAAVWVQMLTCHEIAAEIEKNLDLLQSHNRQHPPRHVSMRAVIDHSWQRLSMVERAAFGQLSVFRGSFDRHAVREITGTALPILMSLTRKSLLRTVKYQPTTHQEQARTQQMRYALHPLLRQYAAEKLATEPDQEAHTKERHGGYYADWLHQQTPALKGGAQQVAIATIAGELDNVHEAWRWAAHHQQAALIDKAVDGLTDFCELRGLFKEGEELLGQAVAQLQSGQSEIEDDDTAIVVAKTLARQGWLNFLRGRSPAAQKQLEEGVGILRVLEAEAELVTPLNYLAYVAYCTDRYAPGLQLSAESSKLAQKYGDKLGLANAHRTAAAIAEVKGELAASIQQYEQALSAYQEMANGQGICWSLLSLSNCATQQGEYEIAIERAQEVITNAQRIGFRLVEGWARFGLGYIYAQQQQYSPALKQFTEALNIGRALHDGRQQAAILNWLGTCSRRQDDLTGATEYYHQALATHRKIGNLLGEGLVLNDLGIVARRNRDYEVGYDLCHQALKIGQEIGNPDLQRQALNSLGNLYSDQERYGRATAAYEESLAKAAETRPIQRLHPLAALAHIAVREKNMTNARALLDSLLPILEVHLLGGTEEPQRTLENIYAVMMAVEHPLTEELFPVN